MKKIDFIKCYKAIKLIENFSDKLSDIGVDISCSPINEYGVLADNLWRAYYTDEGVDLINWDLYEKNLAVRSLYESEEDINELYNTLEENYRKNV